MHGGAAGVAGNAYTGQSTAGARGFTYNTNTGNGVAHTANNTYADHDGNVYKYNPSSGLAATLQQRLVVNPSRASTGRRWTAWPPRAARAPHVGATSAPADGAVAPAAVAGLIAPAAALEVAGAALEAAASADNVPDGRPGLL